MIHFEPLGTECILPAFVVGYELPLPKTADNLAHVPQWIVTIDQQAGGMAMRYPSIVGAVLRLDANQDKGKQPLADLIRGLRCMAEDPNKEILRSDFPVLSRLVCTVGNDYAASDLRDLEGFLSSYLFVPEIQSGIEAFIRCAHCDPMKYFAHWKVLECTLGEGASYLIDNSNISDLTLTDAINFNEKCVVSLIKLAKECGATTVNPSVFLLWENCD